MQIDFGPLQDGGLFTLIRDRKVGLRQISLYLFNRQHPLGSAVEAIEKFLELNRELIPIFPTDDLLTHFSNNQVLVINDRRVCLKGERETPPSSLIGYTDAYFNEAVMTDPVRCSKSNHIFDLLSYQYYRENYRELDGTPSALGSDDKPVQCPCPAATGNDSHLIGEGDVDYDLKYTIDQIRQTFLDEEETRTSRINQVEEKTRVVQLQSAYNKHRDNQLSALRQVDWFPTMSTFGAFILKLTPFALMQISRALIASGGKGISKSFTSIVGKRLVPGVNLVLALVLAKYRWKEGEYYRALLELVSGAAGCIPVVGLIISLGIDAIIIGLDLVYACEKSHAELDPKGNLKVQINIHEALGLDPDQPLTKEAVEKAYKEQIRLCHPDNLFKGRDPTNELKEFASEVAAFVNNAKEAALARLQPL